MITANEARSRQKTLPEDVVLEWGKGFEFEDYEFLERELAEYKKSYKCETQIIRCEYCDSENIIDNTTGAKKCTQCGAVLKLHCEKEKQNSSEFNSVMADWIKFHEESCPWSDTIETEEQTLQKKKKYALRDFLETLGIKTQNDIGVYKL